MLNNGIFVITVCMALCVGQLSAESCVTCDSSVNANCAVDAKNLLPQVCKDPNSQCYARVVAGVTYRGCLKELDEEIQKNCFNDTTGKSCFVCENVNGNNGCNNLIFPVHRLRCHGCFEENLNSNCFNAIEGNASPCRKYDPEDKCYIRKTEKSIERGCLSDTTKCNNATHCFICQGEGCNNKVGNSTDIPTAPNAAAAWTSTIAMVLTAFICLKLVA